MPYKLAYFFVSLSPLPLRFPQNSFSTANSDAPNVELQGDPIAISHALQTMLQGDPIASSHAHSNWEGEVDFKNSFSNAFFRKLFFSYQLYAQVP